MSFVWECGQPNTQVEGGQKAFRSGFICEDVFTTKLGMRRRRMPNFVVSLSVPKENASEYNLARILVML